MQGKDSASIINLEKPVWRLKGGQSLEVYVRYFEWPNNLHLDSQSNCTQMEVIQKNV